MPHIDIQQTYKLSLTAREFRLVTMALADLLEDDEDIQDALRLNTQLCSQRERELATATDTAKKALTAASELENPNAPPIKR